MRSFTLITSTPGLVANFLEARGVIQKQPDGSYLGVLPGLEWIEVPNPIQTDPGSGTPGEPGYVPPTYDNRHVYLVKFSAGSLAQKADGFAQWLADNTTRVTAPANYLIHGEPAGDALKVNNQQIWLVKDDPDRFGVWQ
jgi:hypothetical protein